MKKLLFSFALTSNLVGAYAQQTYVDFESFNLSQADTFYNGSDELGGFDFISPVGNTISFNNSYFISEFGDYWSGFAYSNMTDVTTPGYFNQYSAITGSGRNNSEKYGIYTPDNMLSFSQNTLVDSFFITNTTFAYFSMLNGDFFGKQFGSVNNASGLPDGTNGEDYFKVWIVGVNNEMQRTDSVEFYLADYRFENNEEDYIINSWTKVNLTSLGSVRHLVFRFESSDMSGIYINTPAYFAIDDFYVSNTLNLDKKVALTFKIFPNPTNNVIQINDFSGKVKIHNFEGKELLNLDYSKNSNIDISSFKKGIYIVHLFDENGNVSTQKITKL
jgi:hypothetical protein